MEGDSCSVQVALRVRPISGSEGDRNCKSVVQAQNSKQLTIGTDSPRPFTFDFVFDSNSEQAQIYEECVSPLVKNYCKGYNATILAYGQTVYVRPKSASIISHTYDGTHSPHHLAIGKRQDAHDGHGLQCGRATRGLRHPAARRQRDL
jgi:hypothetical protein